jgi:hypothetical protein
VRHTYLDSDDEPRYFNPAECEIYNIILGGFNGFDANWLVARIGPRLWIKGEKVGLIVEVNLDLPPYEVYMIRWKQVKLKEVVKYFDDRKKSHPDSLVADIEASRGIYRSSREERDRFFYEERVRGDLTDGEILAQAKLQPFKWDCAFSINNMRKLAKKYGKDHGLPPIPPRKRSRQRPRKRSRQRQ